MDKSLVYWAAEPTSEKAVAGALERIRRYREWMRQSGRLYRIKTSWNTYRGVGRAGLSTSLTTGGERGELIQVFPNEYASLLNQVVVLTTQNKPAFKAVARNSDYQAIAQCQIADAVLEHYDRQLETDEHEVEMCLGMLALSEMWSVLDWDTSLGRTELTDENGRELKEGDLAQYTVSPFDVAYDWRQKNENQREWILFRRPVDRWLLASQYPHLAEKIINAPPALGDVIDEDFEFQTFINLDSDAVWLWELRHRRSLVLPMGRQIRFISQDCVLFDTVTPEGDKGYAFGEELFAYREVAEKLIGTGEPHSLFFDMLSLQEGLALGASIVASAVNAGGLQNWLLPRSANVTIGALSGGLNEVLYDGPQKPEVVTGAQVPPAVLEWADMCAKWMRQRSAINDVVMGETKAGMPAQMAALLRAEALEFHSNGQRAHNRFSQKHREGQIKLLKKFAKTRRVAAIVGSGGAWAFKEWSREDIEGVEGVPMEPVSAQAKTYAQRVSIADSLLEKGLINDPQQYLNVYTTGRLDPVFQYAQENKARIQKEKELLMRGIGLPPLAVDEFGEVIIGDNGLPLFAPVKGEFVVPMKWDSHDLDLKEYRAVLASPSARQNPEVQKAVTQVADLKLRMWATLTPDELFAYGLPPLPSQMPPPMGEMPTETGVAAPGEGDEPKPDPERADASLETGVRQPAPPPNPITGEQQPPPL